MKKSDKMRKAIVKAVHFQQLTHDTEIENNVFSEIHELV